MVAFLLAVAVASTPPPVPDVAVCTPTAVMVERDDCGPLGPAVVQAQVAAASVPTEVDALPVEQPPRFNPVVPFTYARVVTADAPVFASPEAALAGTPARTLGKGFIFVNLTEGLQAGDLALYRIRSGELIRAADVQLIEATTFQGVLLTERPERAFGWVIRTVRPSPMPGVEPSADIARVRRNTLFQVYGTATVNGWTWYLIGRNQWVEQRNVAVAHINPRPEGVRGRWVQVDLYEQTLVAYEGDTPVFATLVSSGLDKWATQPGLFQVYARLRADRMRGAYEPDRSDYYSLEMVPWVMYFDGDRALHGQYWHDGLGYKRSHGCVNLSPLDARWLYDWTAEGTWVWVYDSGE